MTLAATVLIPTHDHGPTLEHSIASALEQTVPELEVFVVGDGAPPEARALVEQIAARDPRVRWFENPKGPRHGEIHRHAALQEARGEIVCYLSDDDLWFPEHVRTMVDALKGADFAHAVPVVIALDGSLRVLLADLARPGYRKMLLGGENRVPLSAAGHTLAAYRRLPHGWRTTPDGIPTDLYQWQQFLAQDDVRAVGTERWSVLNFPARLRAGVTAVERARELAQWRDAIQRRADRERIFDQICRSVLEEGVRTEEAARQPAPSPVSNLLRRILRRTRALIRPWDRKP